MRMIRIISLITRLFVVGFCLPENVAIYKFHLNKFYFAHSETFQTFAFLAREKVENEMKFSEN